MQKPFFITTAIDYTNAPPHIGHAYEKVLADALARYYRLLGREVFFLTGVDQHGQKVQQSAEKAGVAPQHFVAEVTGKFVALWKRLEVCYDGWAATTEDVHKRVVQSLLQQLHGAGQIYKKATRGWYSIRQEQFLSDKDRGPDGQFGSEWGQVEEREEENYYFRLSDHVEWLLDFLDRHPETVFPDSRYAQLRNAAEESREIDLCISRPKHRLQWGIELPFDRDYVTFVWFDALVNYISFAGYRKESGAPLPDFDRLWPCDAHVIGKDILVPAHGIYWLIMLHALGFRDEQMPGILVHGWWNVKGEKMSKTLGNVVNPHDIADVVGVDGLRYYLLSDIATGGDSDMSEERVITRYNKDLADVLGNLLNRTLNMSKRYLGGEIQETDFTDEHTMALRNEVEALPGKVAAELPGYQIHKALAAVWEVLASANAFIQVTEPFKLAKDPANTPRVWAILAHLAETLAHCSVLIGPVIPNAAREIHAQLGWTPPADLTLGSLKWGMLRPGHKLGEGRPLFPKVEMKKEA